jgi:hypothetical protein
MGEPSMVTRLQIEKLNARIDEVAAKLDPNAPAPFAIIKRAEGESRAQAMQRHFMERPQDRMSPLAILLDKSPHCA